MGGPATPKNPQLLLFDTDALSQFLVTQEYTPFKILKRKYEIQCAIVEAVDFELRQNRKFYQSIEAFYQKCLRTEVLLILDDRTYPAFVSSFHAVSTAISLLGTTYSAKIQPGEAYTHAASVTLQVPVVSNDRKALAVMDKSGLAYQSPVLGTFDIVVLAHQGGDMTLKDCDKFRKEIRSRANEYVPEQFRHVSFEDGLPSFSPRIVCSKCQRVGGADPTGQALVVAHV